MRYKVAFVTGLPNWHFPELYKMMARHPKLDLTVLFCENWDRTFFKQAFGIEKVDFGVNLLGDYKYKFLKNYSPIKPKFGRTRIFSHLNFGIWKEIRREKYHAVVITMWNDFSYWLAAIACKLSRIPFFFAGDSTILTEQVKPRWGKKIKRLLLGRILFPMASGFLYRTEANRRFYLYYGVAQERLFFFPLSVDYKGLNILAQRLTQEKEILRAKYGIPKEALVILFVGRLADEKRPFDLIKAYAKLKEGEKRVALVFVGDGYLKRRLHDLAKEMSLRDVYFLGFRPKTEVPNFYALADVLVLPSDYEPHGDVVKEAMCFGLPVIVSDKVGASYDVVKHGENGFVYPCGDTERLASYIDELSDEQKRKHFGKRSREIIKDWGHDRAINGLIEALDFIYKARG